MEREENKRRRRTTIAVKTSKPYCSTPVRSGHLPSFSFGSSSGLSSNSRTDSVLTSEDKKKKEKKKKTTTKRRTKKGQGKEIKRSTLKKGSKSLLLDRAKDKNENVMESDWETMEETISSPNSPKYARLSKISDPKLFDSVERIRDAGLEIDDFISPPFKLQLQSNVNHRRGGGGSSDAERSDDNNIDKRCYRSGDIKRKRRKPFISTLSSASSSESLNASTKVIGQGVLEEVENNSTPVVNKSTNDKCYDFKKKPVWCETRMWKSPEKFGISCTESKRTVTLADLLWDEFVDNNTADIVNYMSNNDNVMPVSPNNGIEKESDTSISRSSKSDGLFSSCQIDKLEKSRGKKFAVMHSNLKNRRLNHRLNERKELRKLLRQEEEMKENEKTEKDPYNFNRHVKQTLSDQPLHRMSFNNYNNTLKRRKSRIRQRETKKKNDADIYDILTDTSFGESEGQENEKKKLKKRKKPTGNILFNNNSNTSSCDEISPKKKRIAYAKGSRESEKIIETFENEYNDVVYEKEKVTRGIHSASTEYLDSDDQKDKEKIVRNKKKKKKSLTKIFCDDSDTSDNENDEKFETLFDEKNRNGITERSQNIKKGSKNLHKKTVDLSGSKRRYLPKIVSDERIYTELHIFK